MAWSLLLRVGDTSTYDVILTASPVGVVEYPLNAPAVNQEAIQNLGDGNSLTVPSWANVIESIDIHIAAATPTLVRDQVRAIERVLDLARQGSIGYLEDKVYLCVKFDQDTEYWRSQILAASYAGAEAVNEIWKNFTTGTIALTRRFFWETETLHAVALSSGPTTTATTGYATVYNADDTHATNQNWFQRAADQVLGSIPAPAKLSIKNASGGSLRATTIYLGNYVYANPAAVDPIFRGEQAAGSTNPTTTEVDMAYWSLAGDNLTDAFKGQFGRVLAVFTNSPFPTTLVRAAMQYRFPAPVLDLALGDYQLNASQDFVMDMGSVPIPPGGNWTDSSSKLYLSLKGRLPPGAGADTVSVDYIQVMPSTAGRYRVLKGLVSLVMSAGDELIDDGPEDAVYLLEGGANRQPIYRPFFSPLYLWPGQINRMRLIISSGSFAMQLDTAWQVSAAIRYRRLTL